MYSCDNTCVILLDDIDRETAGSAHYSIIGLTQGISFLISLLTTIFITMGWFESKLKKKRASDQQVATVIKGMYNPPGSTEKKKLFEVNLEEEYNAAKDVAHCSQLLRQMYTLDFAIWGMEDCSAAEIPQREEMKDRANVLFEEIRDIVQNWKSPGGLGSVWTADEKELVDEISKEVCKYPVERYELGTRAAARRR